MSTAHSDRLPLGDGNSIAVELRPHPRARRLKLRYDARADRLLLTLPPRQSPARALAWASEQQEWISGQRAKRAEATPLIPGATIPFSGSTLQLVHRDDKSRIVRRVGVRLESGGPLEGFPGRIERWLKAEALTLLSTETARLAEQADVRIRGVSVGDARTRWGSCTSDGIIRYNWRLICAPPDVLTYVVAHEVAHRLHMNHGPAFHVLEAELFGGDPAPAKKKLRSLGPRLQRIGR